MENASKALIIAGGILLALLTLSLFVYMMTATDRITRAQDEKKIAEELTAFNSSYEAYNKSKMYGTDIITVVNKAIENNKKMQVIRKEDPYYINIKINIKRNKKYTTTIEKEDKSKTPTELTKMNYSSLPTEVKNKFGIDEASINSFLDGGGSGKTYDLGSWQGNNFVTNNNFVKFFQNDTDDSDETDPNNKKIIYHLYSGLTNFKRDIFQCKDIKYDDNGRIYEMTFEQL